MSQTTQRNSETYAGTESLAEGENHRLMAVGRRRTTLAVLDELSVPIDLDDLAAAVGKREMKSTSLDKVTIDQIETELHHIHLPMMDCLGVIDYDQDTNRVVAWS